MRSAPGWQFTIGNGYRTKASVGPWGALSIITGEFQRAPIVTQTSTPLLDEQGRQIGSERIEGATTIELTDAERRQSINASQLWAQGGTPADPVLAQTYPGPQFAFGALRCATDNLNGDNVEFIYFPAGVTHVFCYALYVAPAPTAGEITIVKRATGAPAGATPSFPFSGDLSYDPNGFTLADGGSKVFYRAGGETWTVTEGAVDGYGLASLTCQASTASGGPGSSTFTISGPTASIHLIAGDRVTCTYTNAFIPPPGGLEIEKITRGGVGTFDYTVTPASGAAPSRVTATTTHPGVPVDAVPALTGLAPGSYRVSERIPTSADGTWALAKVTCDGVSEPIGAAIDVTVTSGHSIICTFVNRFTPSGSISLSKITQGGTGTAAFLVISQAAEPVQFVQHATTTPPGVPAAAKPHTPADALDGLPLGAYAITESPPLSTSGVWELTEVECNGVLQSFNEGRIAVTLTSRDPRVHCVFTNAFTTTPLPPVEPPTVVKPPVEPPPGATPPPIVEPPGVPAPEPPQTTGDPDLSSDVGITKQASPAVVDRTGIVTYEIGVTNHGPDAAAGVLVDDLLPSGMIPVEVSAERGHCAYRGAMISCRLGDLTARQAVMVSIRVRVENASSTVVNRAVVSSETPDPNPANNTADATVRVQPVPGTTGPSSRG